MTFGQQYMSRFFSGFAENLQAQKLNKTQTKQAHITGAHYFPGFWSGLHAHGQE